MFRSLAAAALAAALTLSGCTTASSEEARVESASASAPAANPAAPSSTGSKLAPEEIVNDLKRRGIALMAAYTATAKGVTIALRTGLIKDPATIAAIREINREAHRHLINARVAIDAGNAVLARRSLDFGQEEIDKLLTKY